MNRWRTGLCAVGLVGAVALSGSSPGARAALPVDLTPVVTALDGPRGLTIGPADRLVFAELDGFFSELFTKGNGSRTPQVLGSVPATYIGPSVSMSGRGQLYVLTAAGAPGAGATLYRWTPGTRAVRVVADIAAYQETDPDPDNLADPPEESNPFNVAVLDDGSVLVADAAANDLLRVFPNGRIITVARLRPRVVAVPAELPDVGFPPAGALLPSEAVATSVAVGADGYYYVGELRGFPATPNTSQVWRIAPDSVNAVCDPAAPNTGPCQRYADGFTSIVALGAGPDGSIYVVELVQQSWLQWELGLAAPIGGLFRIPPGGGPAVELAAGELILPGGVAVTNKGQVFVTTPVFGPGMVAKVR